MFFKRVRKVALIVTFGIAIPLFLIQMPLGLGFALGGLTSLLCFEILRTTTQKAKIERLRRSLVGSRIVRMLIYASSLIISLILPSYFSFYSLFLGLFVIKLSIVVVQYFMKGFDSNEYFDV